MYRCTNCNTEFDHDAGKLRCPNCLRTHGLERIIAAPARPRPRIGRRHLLLVLAVTFGTGLVVAAAVLLMRSRTDLPKPGELSILDPGLLGRTLAHRGVPEADRVNPFATSPELRRLASGARGSSPVETAQNLARSVSKLLHSAVLDLDGTADDPVRSAAQLLAALEKRKPGKTIHLLGYELAALVVAALREAGLSALICQTHTVSAPVPTAEITGGIGRYLAAVYRPQNLGQDPLAVLDPIRALELPAWAGTGKDPEMGASSIKPGVLDLIPLDDASAAAHLLGLRALRLRLSTPARAYHLSALATEAAAPSATLQLIRAKVLAGAGGIKDAVSAARRALSIQDGPPQKTTLAQLLLSSGAGAEVVTLLEQAVRQDPAYWPAQMMLAAMFLPDDPERGNKHLEAGLKVAPEQPGLLMIKASVHLARGEASKAIPILRTLAERSPSEQALVLLYQALARSDDEEHTRQAADLKKRLLSEAKDRERMEQLLAAIDQAESERPTSAEQPSGEQPSGEQPSGEQAPAEQAPPKTKVIPRISLPDVSLGR